MRVRLTVVVVACSIGVVSVLSSTTANTEPPLPPRLPLPADRLDTDLDATITRRQAEVAGWYQAAHTANLEAWYRAAHQAEHAAARAARPAPTRQPTTQRVTRPYNGWPIPEYIVMCESGGNYQAENPRSTASGAFQFLDSTWVSVTGLAPPASAYPPSVQDAAAAKLWNNGAGASHWECA